MTRYSFIPYLDTVADFMAPLDAGADLARLDLVAQLDAISGVLSGSTLSEALDPCYIMHRIIVTLK